MANELTFQKIIEAYIACRKRKRKTKAAIEFEFFLEENLAELFFELIEDKYEIAGGICFIVIYPKAREVWAASFRDRIVHHLVYNQVSGKFYKRFIKDTFSCIPGRGTANAAKTLAKYTESVTCGNSIEAYYLKADIKNFFVTINKDILYRETIKLVNETWAKKLIKKIIYHDPRNDVTINSPVWKFKLLPKYKSLWCAPLTIGLPIGNLTSQFFSNVYLDILDQYIKHKWRCKFYCRYVDDFIILDTDPSKLNKIHLDLCDFLEDKLKLQLHRDKKTINKIKRGIDFVGFVKKPYRLHLRQRTIKRIFRLIKQFKKNSGTWNRKKILNFTYTINSYLGFLRNTRAYNVRKKVCLECINLFVSCDRDFTKIKANWK